MSHTTTEAESAVVTAAPPSVSVAVGALLLPTLLGQSLFRFRLVGIPSSTAASPALAGVSTVSVASVPPAHHEVQRNETDNNPKNRASRHP
ncbi:MAG: hypothetical protein BMS9Abin29_2196 [Gemmatimonadota bacterium]|nr:MAG: hypothetical protein BMS9Abin29_2196 [Gemmatimonadota bacterium]